MSALRTVTTGWSGVQREQYDRRDGHRSVRGRPDREGAGCAARRAAAERVFTPAEIAYAERKANRYERYAARSRRKRPG